jgi:type IV pilus assembly protein PilE
MKKMFNKALKGFTLVELIVVIAIIAILSTVGFVSYTGYIRDSRNSVRQSDLSEAVNVITQFVATEGRAPACATPVSNDVSICYFSPSDTTTTLEKNAATAAAVTWQDGTKEGINVTDWSKLNVRKAPMDPKKVYYLYAVKGDKFALFATKEEAVGYSTLASGSESLDTDLATFKDKVNGWGVDSSSHMVDTTQKGFIVNNGDSAHVPYDPAAGTTSQVQQKVLE